MLQDGYFTYLALTKGHEMKPVKGDAWLMMFMVLFFGWTAYLLIRSVWWSKEENKDESGLD